MGFLTFFAAAARIKPPDSFSPERRAGMKVDRMSRLLSRNGREELPRQEEGRGWKTFLFVLIFTPLPNLVQKKKKKKKKEKEKKKKREEKGEGKILHFGLFMVTRARRPFQQKELKRVQDIPLITTAFLARHGEVNFRDRVSRAFVLWRKGEER